MISYRVLTHPGHTVVTEWAMYNPRNAAWRFHHSDYQAATTLLLQRLEDGKWITVDWINQDPEDRSDPEEEA